MLGGLLIPLLSLHVLLGSPVKKTARPDGDRAPEDSLQALGIEHEISNHETEAIVVAPDGMVRLVETDSGNVRWSFSSGPPIYSSFRRDEKLNEGYVDCGDNWDLFLYRDGLTKKKLPYTAEELVKHRPVILYGDRIMTASKKDSQFLIDGETGRVISRSDDLSFMDNEDLLFLKRTDYTIKYASFKTGEVLWDLRFADIDVSFQLECEEINDLLLKPECLKNCQKKPVCRIRDGSTLASFFQDKSSEAGLLGEQNLSQPIAVSASYSNNRTIPVGLMAALQLHVAAWRRDAKNKKKKSEKKKSKKALSQKKPECSQEKQEILRLTLTEEIAKGSNGTIVFEGDYQGRSVVVKRVLKTHHNLAANEKKLLIAADEHPNIVRFFGLESDHEYDYICLELCPFNLYDLILNNFGNENGLQLWKNGDYPSELLLEIMRDTVRGVAGLHKLGIVHGDLKPQDVLIDRSLRAKISDMGISQKIDGDMFNFIKHATVDLYRLGCILSFCMTKGEHPSFKGILTPDEHIYKQKKWISLIEKRFPEAHHLISGLVQSDPKLRTTTAEEAIDHPLFWDSDTRLIYLRDVSDMVEPKSKNPTLRQKLEMVRLGTNSWDKKIDKDLFGKRSLRRVYDCGRVCDLLRLIRNTINHPDGGSEEDLIQFRDRLDTDISTKFPKLFFGVYEVVSEHLAQEKKKKS